MKPLTYLIPCYNEDGDQLGYTDMDCPVPGAIPVVSQSDANELLFALEALLNMPEFDGTQETSSIRRDAKNRARSLIQDHKEIANENNSRSEERR